MHAIYDWAILTIIAAHGEDEEAGLPGVSVVSRSEQPSAISKAWLTYMRRHSTCSLVEIKHIFPSQGNLQP